MSKTAKRVIAIPMKTGVFHVDACRGDRSASSVDDEIGRAHV